MSLILFFSSPPPLRHLHSFPTRRSSDLPVLAPRDDLSATDGSLRRHADDQAAQLVGNRLCVLVGQALGAAGDFRSEEHTSELQSRPHLVCRLLLEKKKKTKRRRKRSAQS